MKMDKVGGTAINETGGGLVYQYSLTSPLSFQAGNVWDTFDPSAMCYFKVLGLNSRSTLLSRQPCSSILST